MLESKPPSSRSASDSSSSNWRQHASSAGEGSPWVLVYNTARRLLCNRAVSAEVVALALLLKERGAMSISQLCSALVLDTASCSALADRAVASGFFVSSRLPGDKRVRLLDLSPTALRRLQENR